MQVCPVAGLAEDSVHPYASIDTTMRIIRKPVLRIRWEKESNPDNYYAIIRNFSAFIPDSIIVEELVTLQNLFRNIYLV